VTVGIARKRRDRQRGVRVLEACRIHIDAKKCMRLMLSLDGISVGRGVGLARIEDSPLLKDVWWPVCAMHSVENVWSQHSTIKVPHAFEIKIYSVRYQVFGVKSKGKEASPPQNRQSSMV
jgi:hypothetical protein